MAKKVKYVYIRLCVQQKHGSGPEVVMRRLTMGILSEKHIVRRFFRCANVMECTYTNLD